MEFRFTKHATEQIYLRGISPSECEAIFKKGKVIAKYRDEKPYPSQLMVGNMEGSPK